MKTRAEFLGHPIHQMVIVLPLGLLATVATFDVIGVATRNRSLFAPVTTCSVADCSLQWEPQFPARSISSASHQIRAPKKSVCSTELEISWSLAYSRPPGLLAADVQRVRLVLL